MGARYFSIKSRARCECPMSSNASVASEPACSSMDSSPSGCSAKNFVTSYTLPWIIIQQSSALSCVWTSPLVIGWPLRPSNMSVGEGCFPLPLFGVPSNLSAGNGCFTFSGLFLNAYNAHRPATPTVPSASALLSGAIRPVTSPCFLYYQASSSSESK